MKIDVRKFAIGIEEIRHDGGPALAKPILKGWVGVVVKNPYAGRYEPDPTPMMEALKPLGLECSTKLLQALGGNPDAIEAYGKGSIIGVDGEIEHGALWHVPGGYAMRELLGRALAIVPSATKVAAMGTALDLPIHHRNAAYVRSHFDAMTVAVPDGPRAGEIVLVLAMSKGPRIHSRMGGLEVWQVKGEDGLR